MATEMQSWMLQGNHQSKLVKLVWIRFNSQGLRVFKLPYQDQPCQFVPLSDILLIPDSKPRNGLSSFKLVTPSRNIIFCSKEDGLVQNWVHCIREALLAPLELPKSLQPEHVLSTTFHALRGTLQARQEELTQLNEAEYTRLRTLGLQQLASISSALSTFEDSFMRLHELRANLGASLALMHTFQQVETPVPECSSKIPVFSANASAVDSLVTLHTELSCVDPCEMNFTRSNITRAVKWHYCGHKVDALTFKVSADIELTGVDVCTPYRPTGVTFLQEFAILNGPATNSIPLYVHTARDRLTHNRQKSLHTVKLPGVSLVKDQLYTVFMICKGSATFKCVDSAPIHYIGRSTKWKFFNTHFASRHVTNCTDVFCGPIAGFRFKTKLPEAC